MSFSEIEIYGDMGPLFAALAKAQAEIRGALKDAVNPHFKSKYADLESTWQACRGPLAANGLAVIQSPFSEGGNIGVVTILGHASGAMISGRLVVAPMKFDAQGAGSTLTYLRRYALAAMVGVAPTDDDGEASVGRPVNGKAAPAKEAAPPAPPELQYDPMTGELMPQALPYTGDYVKFGRVFIDAIKTAESLAELNRWEGYNKAVIEGNKDENGEERLPKAYNSIIEAIDKRRVQLWEESRDETPPNPLLGG
jgi:hypothetical protein